jgi:hypothetical protein
MSGGLSLVLLATGGTAALIGAAFLLGFNKSGGFESEAGALECVIAYAPDEKPCQAVLDYNKTSALVLCESQRVYLVIMLGADPSVRHLKVGDITQDRDGHITLDPKDFGFPKRDFYASQSDIKPIFDALKQGTQT